MADREKISGTISRVIWESSDGGFSVFRLDLDASLDAAMAATATVTLNSPAPPVGQMVELRGEWMTHPRFGHQFKADSFQIVAPTDAEAIEKFLASGVIAGIGPSVARRLVARFGEETLDIIHDFPHRLTEVQGIGAKTAQKIHNSYAEQYELKDITLWLDAHGASSAFAARLYKEYGSAAIEILENNPYRVADEVSGIGFITCDTIARASGIEADDPERLAAGLNYVLNGVGDMGHVVILREELVKKVVQLLGVSFAAADEAIDDAIRCGFLPIEEIGDSVLCYPPFLYEAECETAERLRELVEYAKPLAVESPDDLIDDWQERHDAQLSAGQQKAMYAALTAGVFVLTGGPGTGKTTVVRGMLDLLRSRGLKVALAAPTGRAAKRLAEATLSPATTLHRLLEASAVPGEPFGRDEDNPIEANAIIVDEASMIDIVLMQSLLTAVPPGCHLILVGDAAQLPAVGPGSVLRDILRSEVVPSVRLTKIFRQAAQSPIVFNAHVINNGREPKASSDLKDEFVFIEIADEEEAAERVVSLAARELPAFGYDPFADIEVLSPMHRGACGVEVLNRRLQAVLNPPDADGEAVSDGRRALREGDKVMQLRNDYEKEVFNGDIGRIAKIDAEKAIVNFDGRLINYEKGELNSLALAYAMTIHKSQGSEYPAVVLPLVDSHYIMLQKTLLYTAVTRAKERVVIVGTRRALYTAVMNIRADNRRTLLTERLKGVL